VSAGQVLVTGASGFIGSRLAGRLAGEGRRVRCLVRPTSDLSRLAGLPIELTTGALDEESSLRRATEGCEQIVHCAALVSDWATVAEIRAANVTGTRNVLAAATAAGSRRFVHISTTDVYGHPGSGPLDEQRSPAGFANWYAQTKLEAEAEVMAARLPETAILRPATVYGPGSVEVVGEIAHAIEGGHMLLVDRGRALAGLCYVENLIDAIVLALDRPLEAGRTFNVNDELPVTWADFTGDLARGLEAPRVRLSLPYGVAMAIAVVMERGYRGMRAATGLRTAPLLSRQAVQVLGRDQSFSAARAAEVLGWRPRVGYADGLHATLAWLRERPRGARRRGASLDVPVAEV
jgi:nucleoside-diphosphate-sugar epimerase